jgi:hypothetical protein
MAAAMNSQDALKKISAIKDQYEEIYPLIRDLKTGVVDCTFGDICDALYGAREHFIALTDGRPRPFDLSDRAPDPDDPDLAACSTSVKESMRQSRKELLAWAICDGPGYDEVATLGGYGFSLARLRALREWIDCTITFHGGGECD